MTYTPFVWLLLLSAFINARLGLLLRRYRDAPSVRQFQVLTWIIVFWALIYGAGISVVYFPVKIFIFNLAYLPASLSTLAFLAFALGYAGYEKWLTRRRFFILLIPPLIFLALAFTSQQHEAWHYDYRLVFQGSLPVLTFQKGVVYLLYAAYQLGLSVASLLIILIPFRNQPLYFRNAMMIAAGLALPVLVALFYVLELTPVRGFNWTPVSFTLTGVMYFWAILRGRLMDVVPIARGLFVENIEEIMVAVNRQNLIVDFNRAAQLAMGLSAAAIGISINYLPHPWAGVFARCEEEPVVFGRTYDLNVSPIHNAENFTLGRIFLLHDITAQKRIEEQERKERILAEALREAAKALNSALDYNSLLGEILENVRRVVPADTANIVLKDENGDMKFALFYGYQTFAPIESGLFKTSPDSFQHVKAVFANGEPIVIPDTYDDPGWVVHPDGEWIRSYAAVPIRMDDKVVGVLNLDSAQAGQYAPEHIDILRAFANQVAVAVKNARLYDALERELAEKKSAEQKLRIANAQLETQLKQIQGLQLILREQAIRDPLTGLYNRRYLNEIIPREVARAKRKSYPISFALIDLDRFKQLNDRHGHGAGDMTLRKLADLLSGKTRVDDIVCRYGGEEFLVALPNVSAEVCFQIAEKWRLEFEFASAFVDDRLVKATFSCGIAAFPKNGGDMEEVVANADKALYAAKKGGRNRVLIWDNI